MKNTENAIIKNQPGSYKKQAKDLKRYFTKEDIRKNANKQGKVVRDAGH